MYLGNDAINHVFRLKIKKLNNREFSKSLLSVPKTHSYPSRIGFMNVM